MINSGLQMPAMLARFGVELIVELIETESEVLDLLDGGVKFGQGRLFAPPRPARADAGGPEPADRRAAS